MPTESYQSSLNQSEFICSNFLKYVLRSKSLLFRPSIRYKSMLKVFIPDFVLYHFPASIQIGIFKTLLYSLLVLVKSICKLFSLLLNFRHLVCYNNLPIASIGIFLGGSNSYLAKQLFDPLIDTLNPIASKEFSYISPNVHFHAFGHLPSNYSKFSLLELMHHWLSIFFLLFELIFNCVLILASLILLKKESLSSVIALFYCNCQLLRSLSSPRIFWGVLMCNIHTSLMLEKCSIVYVDCADPLARYYQVYASMSNIQHVQVQASLVSRLSYEWIFCMSDHLCLWDNYSASCISVHLSNNILAKQAKILLHGNPRLFPVCSLDKNVKELNSYINRNLFNILFLSTYPSDFCIPIQDKSILSEEISYITKSALLALTSLPGVSVSLKPHPLDINQYDLMFPDVTFTCIDKAVSSESIIPCFNLVVGFSSTSIIKCISTCIPYILLASNRLLVEESFERLVDNSSVYASYSTCSLLNIAKNIMSNKPAINNCISSSDFPVESRLGSFNFSYLTDLADSLVNSTPLD